MGRSGSSALNFIPRRITTSSPGRTVILSAINCYLARKTYVGLDLTKLSLDVQPALQWKNEDMIIVIAEYFVLC